MTLDFFFFFFFFAWLPLLAVVQISGRLFPREWQNVTFFLRSDKSWPPRTKVDPHQGQKVTLVICISMSWSSENLEVKTHLLWHGIRECRLGICYDHITQQEWGKNGFILIVASLWCRVFCFVLFSNLPWLIDWLRLFIHPFRLPPTDSSIYLLCRSEWIAWAYQQLHRKNVNPRR